VAGCDVLIVGAGPAGAVAGTILARAGARVRIVDRATFPRDKLCGDTVNPGTVARLQHLDMAGDLCERSLRVCGMLVTGERGVTVEGRYPDGQYGLAILRRDFDWMLLQHAISAGCVFEPGVTVRRAVLDDRGPTRKVCGVISAAPAGEIEWTAPVTIAADGRHSTLAFSLGLARHPSTPRRWAIGAYYENFRPDGMRAPSIFGEMHIRRGRYIGISPVAGGTTNVCLVRPSQPADAELRDPSALLDHELARDPFLRERAAGARRLAPPVVLGPLAVDPTGHSIDGLLTAGDASGFIDPMTGDGLGFAIRGAELAAASALRSLERGWSGVHADLDDERRHLFRGKWRFNRALRALVASPRAVEVAAIGALLAPAVLRAVIARAGDCHLVPG
jgi:flavin-dependent dehydrogenase